MSVDVLANDEVGGDAGATTLEVDGTTVDPSAGTDPPRADGVTVEVAADRTLSVQAPAGFLGEVVVTYRFVTADGSAATALATVLYDEATLAGAQQLADRYDVGLLAPDGEHAPATSTGSASGEAQPLELLPLLTSFGETIQATRVPMGLLVLGSTWTLVFGGIVHLALRRRRLVRITGAAPDDAVAARRSPDREDAVFRFRADASGIWATGRRRRRAASRWVEVETPAGNGWLPERSTATD